MKNPFVYGETVSGKHFCNRVLEIDELVSDIKNGVNVIIFSPRRGGEYTHIERIKRLYCSVGRIDDQPEEFSVCPCMGRASRGFQ